VNTAGAALNHVTAGAITFSIDGPSNASANGGGITLKGTTDKTINWIDSTGAWTSNQVFSAPNFVSTVAVGTQPYAATSTTVNTNLNADLLDGLHSTAFLRVYRGVTTLTNLDTFYRIARVDGDSLSSSVRMSLTGTTGNVVVNVIADILVNHSQDIVINSQSGEYTQVTIRVQSNNDEDFDIYVKYNVGSAGLSIQTEIISYTNDTVTLNPSATAYTGFFRDHTTISGTLNAQVLSVLGNTV
jgi:hypothetical protein